MTPGPARPRTARALGLLLAASLAVLTLTVVPAQAVGRTTLQNNIQVSLDDYAAAKRTWSTFQSYDRSLWSGKYTLAARYLANVRARLAAADTQQELDAVAPYVYNERKRARVFRVATVLGDSSFRALKAAITAGQDAFAQRLGGTLADTDYAEVRSDAAAVSALAAKDRRRAWAALLTTTAPTASEAAPAVGALSTSDRATAPAGWVGVPGGCAVPAAEASWLGHAGEPGVHLWVDQTQVDAARIRSTAITGLAATAHSRMMASADRDRAALSDDLTAVSPALQRRAQRLGYSWLVTGDTDAAQWLRDDLTKALLPGPKAANVLRDAVSLEALATDLDWLGLDEDPSAEAATLREALLVRWLAPLSCRFDNVDPSVTGNTNIPIAVVTAALHGSYALGSAEPALAAALVRASLTRLMPGITAMTQDGGSFEGPSYWILQARFLAAVYGTSAAVYAGLTPPVTLPSPGNHPAYAWSSTDSQGRSLPFADAYATPEALRPGLVAWMAHKTGEPRAGAFMRRQLENPTEGFQVLWWPTDAALAAETPPRRSMVFKRTGLAALQAGDTTAWLRGGTSRESHAHLDLGMVGYSRYGVAWAVDPGKGDYSLPQYSSRYATSKRWTYWKLSSRGHSTLSPTTGQPPLKSAPFSSFAAAGSDAVSANGSATVDLRQVMPGAGTATRTTALAADGTLTVTDKVTSSLARSWVWRWVTDASITVTGTGSARVVTLFRDDKVLVIRLSGLPTGTSVSVVDAPSDATGPDGRPLRVLTLTLGKTTRLALTATVS